MDIRKLQRVIVDGLEDVKAQNIVVFNTEHLSPLFERVIVASGTSNRQTRSLAASVRDAVKSAGEPAPRTEGEDNGEWIIVDCGAAVVHVMQPAIREYYHLEELWGERDDLTEGAREALRDDRLGAGGQRPQHDLQPADVGDRQGEQPGRRGAEPLGGCGDRRGEAGGGQEHPLGRAGGAAGRHDERDVVVLERLVRPQRGEHGGPDLRPDLRHDGRPAVEGRGQRRGGDAAHHCWSHG